MSSDLADSVREGHHVSRRTLIGGAVGLAAASPMLETAAQASSAGSDPSNDRPLPRPVIWTTEDMLRRAKERVANQVQPFYGAWLKTLAEAERVLGSSLDGYHGPNQNTYFSRGQNHGRYARDLAISYRVTGDQRFLAKAKQLLHSWARDAIDHPYPDPPRLSLPGVQGPYFEPNGIEVWPGSDLPHGSGLRTGRVISKFADAYAMIWPELTADERAEVEEWMRLLVPSILETQRLWVEFDYHRNDGVVFPSPYFDQQYYNNHLTAQTLGLAAIGYAVRDQTIINHAIIGQQNPRDLQTLIDGVIFMPGDAGSGEEWDLNKDDPTVTSGMPEPLPGEIYDRYRVTGHRGMFYALTNLRFLTLMAEMTHNNRRSRDYYEYVGPRGENLEVSYDVYSPWWITGQASSVNSPYYDHEQDDPGFNRIANDGVNHELSMWELAARRYPGNAKLREALQSYDRVIFDGETWGWTAVLTHGPDIDG